MQLRNFLLFLIMGLLPAIAMADWLREEAAIMGTAITVELWHEDPAQGRALIEAVFTEMRRIDALMSSYKPDSELSRVNTAAANSPVTVSKELYRLIEQALYYSDLTHGAFDITYASAGRHYDYRSGRKPDSRQLEEALPAIDYRHVKLDAGHSTVHFLQAGVHIDLGGIAKGYAVDRSMAILKKAGVGSALISAGGDTRVMGKRWDQPWKVGIRDPRDRDGLVSVIPLEDAAISTSGDYERFFEKDGVRYHHILDPATGQSAREVHSTSIISTNATDTDALSTSVFVMGVKDGLALINSIADTEAIIIDNQGQLHYSSGLARVGE
jgi:thiamine biosynthesis lipoprotein